MSDVADLRASPAQRAAYGSLGVMMKRRRKRLDEADVDLWFGDGSRRRDERKNEQLCAQVARALSLALTDSADATLSSAWVRDVEPLGGVGQLRVWVMADTIAAVQPVREALERRASYLRSEVASAICRKRAPSLRFVVLPPGGPEADW